MNYQADCFERTLKLFPHIPLNEVRPQGRIMNKKLYFAYIELYFIFTNLDKIKTYISLFGIKSIFSRNRNIN